MRGFAAVLAGVAVGVCAAQARAHDGEPGHRHAVTRTVVLAQAQAEGEPVKQVAGVTGQGPYRFKVRITEKAIPDTEWGNLRKAHGGFAVDHRKGKGEAYFGLPNTGILRINAAMDKVDVLDASPELKDGGTMHNASIWYDAKGTPFLVFPGVDRATIFTTDLDGHVINKLTTPTADQMTEPVVKTYFADPKGTFVPTDAVHYEGRYYISTGYSALDYVLTAKVTSTDPFTTEWDTLAFGGKGDADNQFRTGHGITVHPDGKSLVVADRPKNRLKRFAPDGKYLDQVLLPEGTLPCDSDYVAEYTLVPCLEGADKTKGAPIYLIKDGKIVSTIMIKEDLGLERFTHIHNAVLRIVDGKMYIIAQAWNPGDFAVLEQVAE